MSDHFSPAITPLFRRVLGNLGGALRTKPFCTLQKIGTTLTTSDRALPEKAEAVAVLGYYAANKNRLAGKHCWGHCCGHIKTLSTLSLSRSPRQGQPWCGQGGGSPAPPAGAGMGGPSPEHSWGALSRASGFQGRLPAFI